jgi:hypothetical protein
VSDAPTDQRSADLSRALRDILRYCPECREWVAEAKAAVEALVRGEHARAGELEQANRALRKELQEQRQQLTQARLALLTGGLPLPRSQTRPVPASHILAESYFTTRNEFLALAQALHEATRKSSTVNWQILLTRAVFTEAAPALLAALLTRTAPASPVSPVAETQLLGEHQRMAVSQVRAQVQRAGQALADPLEVALQRLATNALLLTWDLLVGSPPGWLILPARDTPPDPAWHQVYPGRPSADAVVGGVVFPGYALRGSPDKVVEKALVYTTPAEGETPEPGS